MKSQTRRGACMTWVLFVDQVGLSPNSSIDIILCKKFLLIIWISIIVSPDELKESFGIEKQPDPATYDPGKALQQEAEKEERKKKTEEMRKKLQQERKEAMEKAKREPLPTIVNAYQQVYGKLPEGFPK